MKKMLQNNTNLEIDFHFDGNGRTANVLARFKWIALAEDVD